MTANIGYSYVALVLDHNLGLVLSILLAPTPSLFYVYCLCALAAIALLPVAVASRLYFALKCEPTPGARRPGLEVLVILVAALNLLPTAGAGFIWLKLLQSSGPWLVR